MNPNTTHRLTGDRNQCPTCGLFFNSVTAFDMHRTGTIGTDRRCLSVDAMRARGMLTNEAGFWISMAYDRAKLSRVQDSRLPVCDNAQEPPALSRQ